MSWKFQTNVLWKCVFLTSLFEAGGRGRHNSLPPERPRMRRLAEVPTSSGLAHSHALAAGVSCGISVRVDANRAPAGSVASRLFPRNRDVFRHRFGLGASLAAEAALSGKFGGRSRPSLCSLITLFISRWQPVGVRAVRSFPRGLTGGLKRRRSTPTTLHWNFHRFYK